MNQRNISAPNRNAPCPCGSGRKYKHCCGAPALPGTAAATAALAAPAPQAAAGPALAARGIAQLRAGQTAAAIASLTAAIKAGAADALADHALAHHALAHHALGSALMQTGRLAEACAALQEAVRRNPASAAAHWDLGAAYDQQNLHEQAIAAYGQAVAIDPHLADVQRRLGQLYAMYGRNDAASDCLTRAAAARPGTTDALLWRSDAALLRGDLDEAERWVRAALAQAPGDARAAGGLAGLLLNKGAFAEAATYFEAALAQDPRCGKYWHGLANCRRFGAADQAVIDRLRAAAEAHALPPGERMVMQFALGKMLEDCGQHEAAMAQYDAANAQRATALQFDHAALAASADRAIQLFTPALLARAAAAAPPPGGERPVFIIGMYRAGTTLVEQILSCHARIAGGGELTIWGPQELEEITVQGDLDPALAAAAARRYLDALARISPDAARITDKLPGNLFRLGAIAAILPQARFIHCTRDARDVCLSIYTTHFATPLPFAARPADLAAYYRCYARLMAHWRAVLPPRRLLEVSYEALIADPQAQSRRMVAFCDLPWDDACLHPERNTRAIQTASAWQARQPIHRRSEKRWQGFAGWDRRLGLSDMESQAQA